MSKMVKYYIGHTNNEEERSRSSSGGIGSAVTKYMLSLPEYGTALTFEYDTKQCQFIPKLVYAITDINICGSVYQDIDILKFIKNNINKIKGGIVVSCPPCQVVGVKTVLEKNGIESFVISFCCSGQTTIEGTWKYLELLGIEKDDVQKLQYRGNGWPSGIQIETKDGRKEYHQNWAEPWKTIQNTGFYRPKRCFNCIFDSSYKSDISLADPWLKDYIENDTIGNTLFFMNTDKGEAVIEELKNRELITYVETDYNAYYQAQQHNVEKANKQKNRKKEIKRELLLVESPCVRKYFTSSLCRMKKYIKLRSIVLGLTTKTGFKTIVAIIIKKLQFKWRYIATRRKLGSYDGFFKLLGGVELNNPKCIHFGQGVGVGANAFFLPVTSNNGVSYEPCIIINQGTWIGKGCSIAAINRVEVGKHVLFAGQVHITDHSHGYEDISAPVTPQRLITKGPVIIEDDCWLGFSCEILSGVHIGKHSIVAARSVVTKDVPPYSIVAGNPARVVKQYNFDTKIWEKVKK